jgi:uncharacterized membrane protein YccF (DUF307 family)
MTLSPGSQKMHVQRVGDITMVTTGAQQLPMWIHVIYFVLVGWWASLVWTFAAYFISLTVVGLPVSFAMFNLVGMVTTLRKN